MTINIRLFIRRWQAWITIRPFRWAVRKEPTAITVGPLEIGTSRFGADSL